MIITIAEQNCKNNFLREKLWVASPWHNNTVCYEHCSTETYKTSLKEYIIFKSGRSNECFGPFMTCIFFHGTERKDKSIKKTDLNQNHQLNVPKPLLNHHCLKKNLPWNFFQALYIPIVCTPVNLSFI